MRIPMDTNAESDGEVLQRSAYAVSAMGILPTRPRIRLKGPTWVRAELQGGKFDLACFAHHRMRHRGGRPP